MARTGADQDLPFEADPADVAEQTAPADPAAGDPSGYSVEWTDVDVTEADEGDLIEQRQDVPDDDEDDPR
jgi:hypothetical protein